VAKEIKVGHERLREIAQTVFVAAGSAPDEARIVADHLVEANLKGHDSHGIIRVPKYADWVRKGELLPNRHAAIVVDKGALLVIDGGFGYGQVIGREAMALMADRAKANGFCAAAIRNSGHLGRIGAWPEQLARAGLTSVHFVNTSGYGILVAPHGGFRPTRSRPAAPAQAASRSSSTSPHQWSPRARSRWPGTAARRSNRGS